MFPDVRVSDLHIHLAPGSGKIPFEPVVTAIRVDLTAAAFEKIVRGGIESVRHKLPVEVELLRTTLVDGGMVIAMRAKRGLLRAELTAHMTVSSHDPNTMRVRVSQLDGPPWLPGSFVLEQGFEMVSRKPGMRRVSGDDRAIDIDPAAMIASLGVPLRLAPSGVWSVFPTSEEIGLAYASESI